MIVMQNIYKQFDREIRVDIDLIQSEDMWNMYMDYDTTGIHSIATINSDIKRRMLHDNHIMKDYIQYERDWR
jgi:hypothetical protein